MEKNNKDKDKMRKIAEIEKQIWKVYDILKKEGLGVEDSHLLLLFLSFYKDGQLEEFLDQLDELDDNQTVGEPTLGYNNQKMNYLHVAAPKEKLSKVSKHHISEQFSNLNKEVLLENFEDLFESVLHQITSSQGRVGGESMQPDELTRFITNLIDLPKGAKVYNPFAGYGSYALYLDNDCEYFGQELDPKTWELGKMRLKAHDRLDNFTYLCEDSILNWPNESEKFDLVVSTPPFGMRLDNVFDRAGRRIREVDQFLIEKGVSLLNEKGKLIALLPQTFLYLRSQHEMRKELIEHDLIDTIISLPAVFLGNISMPLAILVIDKDKERAGKIRLIDANKFVHTKENRNKQLIYKELNQLIETTVQDTEWVKFVDIKQIALHDYNLGVSRYFLKPIKGTRLDNNLLEYIIGDRTDIPDTGKLVNVKDLKEDKTDFILDASMIENSELHQRSVRQINESCLLLTGIRATLNLKPTFFNYTGTPIYISHNILAFRINEEKVLPAYLINELSTEYVKEQLEAYIPTLNIHHRDFLQITIKLPEKGEQQGKVEGIFELSNKIKMLQEELNALSHGKDVESFNEFASLKHTLGRPRANILGWADSMDIFFKRNYEAFEPINKAFKKFYDYDVFYALKEIKDDVSFMTKVLEKGEDGLNIDRYAITYISLFDIKELISSISNNRMNFKIKRDLLKNITKTDELKSRGIEGNIDLFKILIDNLLTNADKHAFDDKSKGNEVFFELTERVTGYLTLEVRNNGKSFPRNYNREKFITKYSTADFKRGTGMGGYDINRIATKLKNPDWKLILNQDPIYPVKFEFQFPIKTID